jgi:hypothetical protein
LQLAVELILGLVAAVVAVDIRVQRILEEVLSSAKVITAATMFILVLTPAVAAAVQEVVGEMEIHLVAQDLVAQDYLLILLVALYTTVVVVVQLSTMLLAQAVEVSVAVAMEFMLAQEVLVLLTPEVVAELEVATELAAPAAPAEAVLLLFDIDLIKEFYELTI